MTSAVSRTTKANEAKSSAPADRAKGAVRNPPGMLLPEMAPPPSLVALQRQMQAGSPPPPVPPSGPMSRIANEGFQGSPSTLPHLGRIQAAFGPEHDVSHVHAHIGGEAANATSKLGTTAFAMGDRVAFQNMPDLHTSAHEAAHVIQQRAGVQLFGGMGKPGDWYENNAEDIAKAVEDGRSAAPFLEAAVARSASGNNEHAAIQCAPEFGKHFDSNSIGVESELSGFVCAMSENEQREFAYVKLTDGGEPLVVITKDMTQGRYTHPKLGHHENKPKGWLTHTVEIVTYPSAKSDQLAIGNRNAAVQFLLDHFRNRITQHSHEPLEDAVSQDGRFTLVVTNSRHIVAAGSGHLIHERGSVGMPLAQQQATMGVKASAFGTSADADVVLLESAPWYERRFGNEEAVQQLQQKDPNGADDSGDVDNLGKVKNAYVYLKSITAFIVYLAEKYNLYLNGYMPKESEPSKANGLTDPRVKNEWQILPRTNPLIVLDGLTERDKMAVKKLFRESAPVGDDLKLWGAARSYVFAGSPVAGRSIDDATVAGEKALLFEFRQIPNALLGIVPKEPEPEVDDSDPLKSLKPRKRHQIIEKIDQFVLGKLNEFKPWYVQQIDPTGEKHYKDKPLHAISGLASAAHKAKWIKATYAEYWAELMAEANQQPRFRMPQLPQQSSSAMSAPMPQPLSAMSAPLPQPLSAMSAPLPQPLSAMSAPLPQPLSQQSSSAMSAPMPEPLPPQKKLPSEQTD